MRRSRYLVTAIAACAGMLGACDGGEDAPVPGTLVISAGDAQSAAVGTAVTIAPAVLLKDTRGRAMARVPVTFAVTGGGGIITGDAVITGPDGVARVGSWTLGTTAGTNTLSATVEGLAPAVFNVTASPGAPADITVAAGNGQSAMVGSAVAVAPTVLVRDQHGNVVPAVTVTFQPMLGSGTVTGGVATTDANGMGRVGSWTLGTAAGAQRLNATVAGLSVATVEATALPGAASLFAANDGNNQTAVTGTAVATPPSVQVRDQFGNPVAGAVVNFTVASGGGTVQGGTQSTNASGIARVGSWVLGNNAGQNTLRAQVSGLGPVTFTATAAVNAPPAATNGYNITVRYINTPTARQQLAVDRAVARWQSVITGDLGNVDTRNNTIGANLCGAHPAISELIDDILIFVDFDSIDGVGKTLGQAGPCFIRAGNNLPVIGRLELDAADLANMEANGSVDDVVLHEIGHVLGIGTLWSELGVLSNAQTDSVTMTGANATAQFLAQGGVTFAGRPVPAENCVGITGCGDGTRDAHWRERVMGRELMTGYITPGGQANPLSRITIQSLADIGYTVNANAADSYTVSASLVTGVQAAPILLKEKARHWTIKGIDESGRVIRRE